MLNFLWGLCSSCQTVCVSFPLCHSVLLGRGVTCQLHDEEEGQVPSGAAPWRFGRVPLFSLDYGGVFWLTRAISFYDQALAFEVARRSAWLSASIPRFDGVAGKCPPHPALCHLQPDEAVY